MARQSQMDAQLGLSGPGPSSSLLGCLHVAALFPHSMGAWFKEKHFKRWQQKLQILYGSASQVALCPFGCILLFKVSHRPARLQCERGRRGLSWEAGLVGSHLEKLASTLPHCGAYPGWLPHHPQSKCSTVWRVFKQLKIELPHDSAIPLWGTYPKESRVSKRYLCTMFVVALFTIAKRWTST